MYSAKEKGAFCLFCVLFPQPVNRGFQGVFITRACRKYNDFNNIAKDYKKSGWHKGSIRDAENFQKIKKFPSKQITSQLDLALKNKIEENRRKLRPILSTIIFCGTNDLSLRGKDSESGNVKELFALRVEAGDTVLQSHLESAPSNAKYTSHRIQNELISICEDELLTNIILDVNNSIGFSILADETADISGIEQLSVGVRFVYMTHE